MYYPFVHPAKWVFLKVEFTLAQWLLLCFRSITLIDALSHLFFLTLASCYGLVFPSYNLIVVLHLVHQFYHGSWQPSYKMIVNFKE